MHLFAIVTKIAKTYRALMAKAEYRQIMRQRADELCRELQIRII
jgi:hypothetical protein